MKALMLLLLLACPAAVDEAPQRPPSTNNTGPLDALSRRFGRLRTRLRERGYGEPRSLRRVFVLEGEGVVLPLDLRTDRCTTIVALGGAGMRELSLSLLDGEGEEVNADATRGEGALVYACPTGQAATAPHYAVLEARQGAAAVVVGEHESERGRGEGFDGLFEGVLSPSVPFSDVEAELAASRTAVRARGLTPVAEIEVQAFAEGEVARRSVPLERGACYSVLVRSGAGVSDVDLSLSDPSGAEVARNLDRDAEPTLMFCADEGGEHALEVRAFEGSGALGVLVARGSAEPLAEVPAEGSEVAPEAHDVPEPAAAVLDAARLLQARGYAPATLVVPVATIGPGEVRTHRVPLGPGCAVVVGATARGTADLDLYLLDDDGRLIARDTGVQPVARVSACVADRQIARVVVKAYGEHAVYALATLDAPPAIHDLRELRLEEATAPLRERGFAPRVETERSLEDGERTTTDLEVPAGECVAVAVAGDEGVEDVDIFLRNPDGELVSSESSPAPYASVVRCAGAVAESLTVETVMYRGSGTVFVVELEGAP